ncbi:SDR family oxidoreductase [Robbsia andropogonis]|nr:SDR family oxidoreductase [Robbsia andropogonis]MCP1128130.1 SDR family oxidoreductase [Robbsia andropogonis]
MKPLFKRALPVRRGHRLEGKAALVTGIGSGIGRARACLFAAQGAQVIGCDIDSQSAKQKGEDARSLGLSMESLHPCHLTQPADTARLVRLSREQHGGFDALVNAAAFGAFAWLQQMNYETQWRCTLTGELDIVFSLCKAAWPVLIARGGGSVINFASANASVALDGSPALAHCAGKWGVLAMTRQLAMEGGPHGIGMNSISPALVETSATRAHMQTDPAFVTSALHKMMIRRIG